MVLALLGSLRLCLPRRRGGAAWPSGAIERIGAVLVGEGPHVGDAHEVAGSIGEEAGNVGVECSLEPHGSAALKALRGSH